ncbi:MAG TPA: hypothetical protein VLH79_15210 [Chthonomonadales bacterium]|nr:hypothetical protein [Chthonomonadales bacterium]
MDPEIAPSRQVTAHESLGHTGDSVAHGRTGTRVALGALTSTVDRAQRWLLDHQNDDGH